MPSLWTEKAALIFIGPAQVGDREILGNECRFSVHREPKKLKKSVSLVFEFSA
jgi:hypothetical protein